jgi:flagellar hook-basal body complex protein FliE
MPKITAFELDAAARLLQQEGSKVKPKDVPKFSDTLGNLIHEVDDLQKASKQAVSDFVAGRDINLHEVMAAGEEAQLSFQLMMEIRNKLVEAYQEVSRMQV